MDLLDLPEFLLARTAEDQRLAEEANSTDPGPWRAEQAVPFPGGQPDGYVETARTVRSRAGNDEPDTLWDVEENAVTSLSVAQHIARHDPARVLAEAQAKRRMILAWPDPMGEWTAVQAAAARAMKRQILLAWAQVYRDHPDFDPAWRV